MDITTLCAWAIGGTVSILCYVWILILAFRVRIVWGMVCLIPFGNVLFVLKHWRLTAMPFLISIVAMSIPLIMMTPNLLQAWNSQTETRLPAHLMKLGRYFRNGTTNFDSAARPGYIKLLAGDMIGAETSFRSILTDPSLDTDTKLDAYAVLDRFYEMLKWDDKRFVNLQQSLLAEQRAGNSYNVLRRLRALRQLLDKHKRLNDASLLDGISKLTDEQPEKLLTRLQNSGLDLEKVATLAPLPIQDHFNKPTEDEIRIAMGISAETIKLSENEAHAVQTADKNPPSKIPRLKSLAGYINTKGKVEFMAPIPSNFSKGEADLPKPFSDGLSLIGYTEPGYLGEHGVGFVNKSGRLVKFYMNEKETPGSFSEGLAAQTKFNESDSGEKKALVGFVDKSWNFVIQPKYSWTSSFHDGLCLVQFPKDKGYSEHLGFIDKTGHEVIALGFQERGFDFSEGLAVVWQNQGGWGYINKNGHRVISLGLLDVTPGGFSDGLALIPGRGYIDHSGQTRLRFPDGVIEAQNFSDGLAAVAKRKQKMIHGKSYDLECGAS